MCISLAYRVEMRSFILAYPFRTFLSNTFAQIAAPSYSYITTTIRAAMDIGHQNESIIKI